MAFDDETIDVLIGGYLSKDAAMQDYESVLGCGGYLHGAVVVTKDLEGKLEVQQTDHMVREGRPAWVPSASWWACSPHHCSLPQRSAPPSERERASSSTTARRKSLRSRLAPRSPSGAPD